MSKLETDPRVVRAREMAADELHRIKQIPNYIDRWRAIRGFSWRLDPQTYIDDRAHCDELKREIVMSTIRNPEQFTKGGSAQRIVSMPEYLYFNLKTADPMFSELMKNKNGESRKLWYMVWKAFPEYRVAQKLRHKAYVSATREYK